MSTETIKDAHAVGHHDNHGHDDHHHHESFIRKYIFSTDHKMISKQFLITGIIMGVLGMGMYLLFRLQLAWPD
jgi:cytochrome c oxidase subunit I